MPWCEHHDLLFIHIPKNAGRSIEAAIGFTSESESTKFQTRSTLNRGLTFLQRATSKKSTPRRLFGTLDVSLCAQHLTFLEIYLLGIIDREKLKNSFKFAVCRNPFGRAFSTYRHFEKTEPSQKGFREFLKSFFTRVPADHNKLAHQRPQYEFITNLCGEIEMDAMLRFENLEMDFQTMMNRQTES